MKVTLELSDKDVNDLQKLFEALAFNEKYYDIPYDYYFALEKIIVSLNTETKLGLERQVVTDKMKALDSWKDKICGTCGHEAWDHVMAGVGICCSEGCPCWKFK